MRPFTIGGALVIGSTALLSLGVLPILLGGLKEAGRLSVAGIGQAVTLEVFGLALGAAVGGYWMGRSAIRLRNATAALGLAAANVATAHAETAEIALLDRTVAGLLAGPLYGTANAIIARSKDADRLTGVLMGGSMTPGMALAYLIPVFLVPQFGVGVGFYALAASVLVASLFTITLVDKLSSLERPETTRVPLHLS